jgi:hypothetical protein
MVSVTSQQLQLPADVVELVLQDQFKRAFKAVHEVTEIEFSGFGNLLLSPTKVRKRLEKLTAIEAAYLQRLDENPADLTTFKKLGSLREDLDFYKKRHAQFQENPGRLQKRPGTAVPSESTN